LQECQRNTDLSVADNQSPAEIDDYDPAYITPGVVQDQVDVNYYLCEHNKSHDLPNNLPTHQIDDSERTNSMAPTQDQAPMNATETTRPRRAISPPKSYVSSMTGKRYAYATAVLEKTIHPYAHIWGQYEVDVNEQVVAAIMLQLSMKAGITKWGEKANEAIQAEMYQLHMRDTFEPLRWEELNTDEKRKILESHLFLQGKRDGRIKERTVAGGNKERGFITKEEASSPTVSTESVIFTSVIDALEARDVAIIDIPNVFIQTRLTNKEEMAIIRFEDCCLICLLKSHPRFTKFM
jgi:hypothetical protein